MNLDNPFDIHAANYEKALNNGIKLSGYSRDWFAIKRIKFIESVLKTNAATVSSVCDFGCGTGDTLPLLISMLSASSGTGFDTSRESLLEAKKRHAAFNNIDFIELDSQASDFSGKFDLLYCSGVFHHIPIADRVSSTKAALSLVKPGGYIFIWENNPWNIGTRWIMSRIAFDRDAILLRSKELENIFTEAGAIHLSTRYHFIFPNILRKLSFMERFFTQIPIGAQYCTIFRKSECYI